MSYFSNKHIKYNAGTNEDVKQKDSYLNGRRAGLKMSIADKKYHPTIDKMTEEDLNRYFERKRAHEKALKNKTHE